eukprot:TRINITY_DN7916_c0_g1_i1.p1 TRINITY_DN7916_c0_g1~~TRINITY_DN7916_c0_g1_i1.p1  ORF type:complete len:229 (-),score=64.65 TRINITY_DN7916_c0_g1_i1:30-716(-)
MNNESLQIILRQIDQNRKKSASLEIKVKKLIQSGNVTQNIKDIINSDFNHLLSNFSNDIINLQSLVQRNHDQAYLEAQLELMKIFNNFLILKKEWESFTNQNKNENINRVPNNKVIINRNVVNFSSQDKSSDYSHFESIFSALQMDYDSISLACNTIINCGMRIVKEAMEYLDSKMKVFSFDIDDLSHEIKEVCKESSNDKFGVLLKNVTLLNKSFCVLEEKWENFNK